MVLSSATARQIVMIACVEISKEGEAGALIDDGVVERIQHASCARKARDDVGGDEGSRDGLCELCSVACSMLFFAGWLGGDEPAKYRSVTVIAMRPWIVTPAAAIAAMKRPSTLAIQTRTQALLPTALKIGSMYPHTPAPSLRIVGGSASVAALDVYTPLLPGTNPGTPGLGAEAGFGAETGVEGRKDGMEGIDGRNEMEETKLEKRPDIVAVNGLGLARVRERGAVVVGDR
ncbi:hypothetical protein LTR95_009983 [Oleoguttula sp. CCFEE 5521]